MSAMSIQATSTKVFSSPVSTPAGSPAEHAYQRAVKALKQAQQNLSKDLGNGADDKTLKFDKVAVQQAAAAVARAQADIAHEKVAVQEQQQQQQQQVPAKSQRVAGSTSLSSTVAVVASLAAADSTLDIYG